MKVDQVSCAWFLLFSICTANFVSGEQFYIVTSLDSPCPTREYGEPCLTLEQYTTSSSMSSSVTLMMESGNHILKESRQLTGSISTSLTIVSEGGAKIILEFNDRLTINQDYVTLNGITFSSNSQYTQIDVTSLQEMIIRDCNFQGVGIYMYNVVNATVSRCTFSDNKYIYYGALYVSYSSAVSVVQSNFSSNRGGAIRFLYPKYTLENLASLIIMKCYFINNTSEYFGGAAIYTTGDDLSVTVNQSTFIYNTAASRNPEGGAIKFDGECTNCTISGSTFISNSAHYCGALSTRLSVSGNEIRVIGSTFYYNRAISEISIGGGAACINNAQVLISNCIFVGNIAVGDGGAMVSDGSTVTVTDTVFSNNTAGRSGGAMITYAYSSNYTIVSSTFIDNRAGDDGGALFIGRIGSNVIVERSNFLWNHAADRGGAIVVLGSSMIVYDNGTNIYDNTAFVGEVVSACSSQVSLPVIAIQQPDPNFLLCTAYDDDIRFSTPTFKELQSYQNITLLVNELFRDNGIVIPGSNPMVNVSETENKQPQSINSKLHQTTIIAHISLTLSAVLIITFLLLGITVLAVYCKFRHINLKSKSKLPHHACNQPESIYEDMHDGNYGNNTDTKGIEMKTNIVYKRP